MNEEEGTRLRYEFHTSRVSVPGHNYSSVLIPVGPTVKVTLRSDVQERWRSYIAAHWNDWHNYPYWAYLEGKGGGRWPLWVLEMFEGHKKQGKSRLGHSARASLSRSYKLVVIQGYVKAASYVAVATRGSGRLSVEFDLPSLNWFQHDQGGFRKPLQVSVCHKRNLTDYDTEHFYDIMRSFSSGLGTVPITSPGYLTFGTKSFGRTLSTTCYGDTLVVEKMNSQVNEHRRGLEVADALFYYTITMGPNLPLLGNLRMWFKELPFQKRPTQGSLCVRAVKLWVQLLRGGDGGREDDDARGVTHRLIKDGY